MGAGRSGEGAGTDKVGAGAAGDGFAASGKRPTGFVVICQDKGIDENLSLYQKDVGIVAQTMLLAAVEQGLGGCMIGNFQAGEVMEVLGLPEEIRPLLIVAFGKPAEEIHLVDVPEDGNTNYYRDENDVHYVPKRERWRMNC